MTTTYLTMTTTHLITTTTSCPPLLPTSPTGVWIMTGYLFDNNSLDNNISLDDKLLGNVVFDDDSFNMSLDDNSPLMITHFPHLFVNSMFHFTTHHFTSHPVSSHHIPSHPVTSHHVTSRHIPSHPITSHFITSRHITSLITSPQFLSRPPAKCRGRNRGWGWIGYWYGRGYGYCDGQQ